MLTLSTRPPLLPADRVQHNRRRSNRISASKREANRLSAVCGRFAKDSPALTDGEADLLHKLEEKLRRCCSNSLYREFGPGGPLEYIGSATCKHKICPVCNAERAKKIRCKYRAYFEANPHLLTDYTPMHLTLTVPHSEAGGFLGERFFAMTLIRLFREVRDTVGWKQRVYAGEYNVEVTRNVSGLHFHIHALVFVYKQAGSRNDLHRFVLRKWNALTVDEALPAVPLGAERSEAIKLGNKTLGAADMARLDARGATMIGLESLYTLDGRGRKHYVKPEIRGGKVTNMDALLGGVMECLKYHFEPFAFKDNKGNYDLPLIVEILPKIHGKPLYQKFGAFRGVSELNLNDDPNTSEVETVAEMLAEHGHEEVIHPLTLKPVERDDFEYVLLSAGRVFHDPNRALLPFIRPGGRMTRLPPFVRTVGEALTHLLMLSSTGRRRAGPTAAPVRPFGLPMQTAFAL